MKVATPAPAAAPQKAKTGAYAMRFLTLKPPTVAAFLRAGPATYYIEKGIDLDLEKLELVFCNIMVIFVRIEMRDNQSALTFGGMAVNR